ncbi:Serine/threonine-protein phosphatase 7 long form-like [Vitis vinifera]|uniref:Serine/threonine-protein phosphatase 7 long form-like n=1 Tax=Vitis vinifera TaxID=29760 RepID=A0A438BMP0_VITVI|nr:Serine/threonine-protein phosphatase 7 long form-like [Vitis vinifera]
MDVYASSYTFEFNPIPHESYWSYPDFPILYLGPTSMRDKSRPRSSRIRNEMDLKEPRIQVSPHDGARTIGSYSSTWTGHTQVISSMERGSKITLQGIAILLGLPVDGVVVTGRTCLDWRSICYSLLGLTLGNTDIDGQHLHFTWLDQSFPTLAPDANEESIQCYTRAYILQLIGGFLFSGKSNDKVHLMFLPFLEDFKVVGRREHIARGEMAIGSLGYHDPYMVWYSSIAIRFLTRTESFHELLGGGAHTRWTRHISILRDAPLTNISPPPIKETPITPMEAPSTPLVVPLVALSPRPIEATLIDEELVHIANDNHQGQKNDHGRGHGRRCGRRAHRGIHATPIEPIVEHAYHRCSQRKKKAPSCGTH